MLLVNLIKKFINKFKVDFIPKDPTEINVSKFYSSNFEMDTRYVYIFPTKDFYFSHKWNVYKNKTFLNILNHSDLINNYNNLMIKYEATIIIIPRKNQVLTYTFYGNNCVKIIKS